MPCTGELTCSFLKEPRWHFNAASLQKMRQLRLMNMYKSLVFFDKIEP